MCMALLTRTGIRINRYCSKADFRFFKMAAVRHLGFVLRVLGSPMHGEYLVVFMTMQNLVAIDAVISIVCKF